ncbi:DNA polymerase III subunit epsilon [Pelagibius litoralis]|uniref:DNA polymerase III subunit epsilon n=1 Tax=Pelagibius litoralis TaxID=374515 RepID=A0A967KE22_9PROT|nr:DNA polymerase III subunit epsilon [Pelagibius litoralis]NIA71714.1 DNA polymerase III subunit epsilon [Pelagibius litoralis]
MREIVLDTETTGLDPAAGHRIVEIAGLELLHHVPTGRTFREFINPQRDMPEEAERIHGLSAEFLADKPLFAAIAQPFLDFIGDAKLVIHNAQFDMKFLNAELKAVGLTTLPSDRAIDTVAMARKRFPGAQVNLDALCRRFEIDNSARTFHGALLDCELLAEVYLELSGGRQPGLTLERQQQQRGGAAQSVARAARPARPHSASDDEKAAHDAMLAKLSDPIWRQ